MKPRLASIAVCAALCALAGAALAADEAEVLRLRAEQLAVEDRCEEALSRVRRARELAPEDGRAALVEGRCALRLNRYEEAVVALEDARRLAPDTAGLAIDLAQAHYHRGDFAAAETELARAEQEMPDDPRVSLYRGLLLLEQANDAEAANSLERAGRLKQDIDPLASYYAGLAWERASERERAQEALRRVEQEAPGSAWAQQASLALERLDLPYRRHWWTDFVAGAAYDDNAVLRGNDVVLPAEISNARDGVAFWMVEGGYELLRNPDWSVGAIASYEGNAYFDLNQFNLHSPGIAAWVDRRIDDVSFVRLQPFFGYAWRDADPYVAAVGGDLAYYRRYESSAGRLFGQVVYDDYLYDIPDDATVLQLAALSSEPFKSLYLAGNERLKRQRDRDGMRYGLGYEHSLSLTGSTSVRAGTDYYHYESQGDEYIHEHVSVWLGVRQDLPWRFDLDVLAGYAYEPYRKPSTYVKPGAKALVPALVNTGPRRRDNIWRVSVLLERPIQRWLKASLTWRFQDNNSNAEVFDYHRHIVGGYLTVTFGE
ncbi:MAG TPA: tetratricopeptide repeat protein [Myxococcota bacterium]